VTRLSLISNHLFNTTTVKHCSAANAAALTIAIATTIALASATAAIINNAIDLISAIAFCHCLGCHRSYHSHSQHPYCHCCRAAVAVLLSLLLHHHCPPAATPAPLPSSLLTYFSYLIVDCFLPSPQLFALAAAAAAATAVFVGLSTRLRRQESVRDTPFANQTRLSLSSSSLLLSSILCGVRETLPDCGGKGGGAVTVEGDTAAAAVVARSEAYGS
jgi:hypothetical protein